jgi:hypothetical protein
MAHQGNLKVDRYPARGKQFDSADADNKSQISITKFQKISKFQYPMIETFHYERFCNTENYRDAGTIEIDRDVYNAWAMVKYTFYERTDRSD